MGKRVLTVVGLLVLHALVCVLAARAGYAMRIAWHHYQILDRVALEEHPLLSIWLLHSQPPLLNVALAAVLRIAAWLGTEPETVAQVGFQLLGAGTVLLTAWLVHALTRSVPLALAGVACVLLDPGFVHFQALYMYTFPLGFALLALLAASSRYLREGTRSSALLVVGLLAAIVLTRTLYHPFFALVWFALLIWLRARVAPVDRRGSALAGAVLVLSLVAWPLKNALVFGHFTYSSWIGLNLAHGTPVDVSALRRFWDAGERYPGLSEDAAALRARYGEAAEVAAAAYKSDGNANWNCVVMFELCPPLGAEALRWRLENPGTWLWLSLQRYAMWSRATYAHPYRDGSPRPGEREPAGGAYARWYRGVLYADLRPLFERALPPGALDGVALIGGRKVPFTVFGVLVFPALVLVVSGAVLARWRERRPEEGVLLLGLFCLLWVLAVPCLTDGAEGNRMRYPASNVSVVLVLAALHSAFGRRERPKALGRGVPSTQDRR